MELIPLILAIITITLFYFLYSYFSTKPIILLPIADLSSANPAIDINTNVSRYAYGLWIYIDAWTSGQKHIFTRNGNINLSLDGNSPTLKCDITTVASTASDVAVTVPIEITNNFPIQKWTYVAINVDNSYVDCYLDGKLVKSKLVQDGNSNPPLSPIKDSPIILGSIQARISKFKYWNNSVNPEDIWTTYKEGNGQSTIMNRISSYSTDITILKDGVEYLSF
jgi:hypothetical protein